MRGIVTHLEGRAPLVVMAVTSDSSSSRLSLSFLTSDSVNYILYNNYYKTEVVIKVELELMSW